MSEVRATMRSMAAHAITVSPGPASRTSFGLAPPTACESAHLSRIARVRICPGSSHGGWYILRSQASLMR